MAFWNQQTQLLQAINDWQNRGLLSAETAEPLRDDVQTGKPPRSFSSLALLLGVICLAFGAMTFVASNWEEMSSRIKVLLLLFSLMASWSAAIYFHVRRLVWAKHGFVFLACALFGVSIMLLGQIYHLQGNGRDAVWLWALGSLVGCLLTRSIPALILTILLFGLWGVWDVSSGFDEKLAPDYRYLIYLAVCGAGAWWMRSRLAGHICLIALFIWGLFLGLGVLLVGHLSIWNFHCGLSISLLLLPVMLTSDSLGQKLLGFERPSLVYLFLFVIVLLSAWYGLLNQNNPKELAHMTQMVLWPGIICAVIALALAAFAGMKKLANRYDIVISALFVIGIQALVAIPYHVPFLHEAVLLASAIWMVRMGWRLEYTPLSRFGFVAFMMVMLLIYAVTVGSLIGTSAFYLGAGVLILAAVFIVRRFSNSVEATV